MKKQHLISLIEKHTCGFLNNISIELEHSHDKWFETFGFPMFGETSKDYYEQVYFQSYLESYIRKMINGILKDLVDYESMDEFCWPEFNCSDIYNGYTNIEVERKFGFEFINKNQRIGYRYTDIDCDQIQELLVSGDVDSIKHVVWNRADDLIGFCYDSEQVDVMNAFQLFYTLFCNLEDNEIRTMYEVFIESVNKSVDQANSMISLRTLPGFTPTYIHSKRSEVLSNLRNKIEELTVFFVKNSKFKDTEEKSAKLIKHYNLPQLFLQERMELAFCGTSHYAKSFLTSEYLFRYFKDNPMFDYTPIVSGYIKSIEQLLYAICKSYLSANDRKENMGSWTMGRYEHFIENNQNILRPELWPDKNIILACLESYRVESRNHLFHRDYFNDWKRVEQIRNNTIFLYVVFLGMINYAVMTNIPDLLGILDEEYDRLFSIIDREQSRLYVLEINGKEYSKMEKEPRYDGIKYTWNGLIRNTISFRKFVSDHYEKIELSPKNMPSTIWSSDVFGNKVKLLWKSE